MMNWRWMVLVSVFGLVVDVVVAAAIAWAIDSYAPAQTFIFILGLLFLGPAAIALYRFAKHWLLFGLFFRKRMAREALKELAKSKMPSPNFNFDIDDYLRETIDLDENALPARIHAAFIRGQLDGIKLNQPWTMGLMMILSAEKALSQYKPEAGTGKIVDD